MKKLSIKEAIKFYNIVLPYLPDEEPEDIVTFTGKIIDGFIQNERFELYLDLLEMLTDKSREELIEMEDVPRLETFIKGIAENRVPFMRDYFDKVGFGHD